MAGHLSHVGVVKGMSRPIADRFGITQVQVSAIVRRKAWAHVL